MTEKFEKKMKWFEYKINLSWVRIVGKQAFRDSIPRLTPKCFGTGDSRAELKRVQEPRYLAVLTKAGDERNHTDNDQLQEPILLPDCKKYLDNTELNLRHLHDTPALRAFKNEVKRGGGTRTDIP